ncbi:MAG: endonuclease/exonuclease/phosphatase family protein [Myxococcota bacterium]|jgi:endonuclease/exonuclease/phosphatase family metal-dependent hydrolase|nr:endonuclease/exonuclease/phosphatase family protein [Myxococcota bacterium]
MTRRWRLLWALPLAGVLGVAGLLLWARAPRDATGREGLRDFPGPGVPPARPGLRVLTFNIAYGRGPLDDAGDLRSRAEVEEHLAAIARTIQHSAADIALLQEVDLDAARTHHLDQVAFLARATGLRHTATAVTWSKRYVPYPFWPPSQHYGPMLSGQAVLSRYPLRHHEVWPLPQPSANPWWYNEFYLTRVAQRVQVALGAAPTDAAPASPARESWATVVNLHLEAFDRDNREVQAGLVAEALARLDPGGLLLVGGDFNTVPPEAPSRKAFADEPDTDMDGDLTLPRLRAARASLQDAFTPTQAADSGSFTFPATAPNRQLDHLLYASTRYRLESATVLHPAPAPSDHLPILVTFGRVGE